MWGNNRVRYVYIVRLTRKPVQAILRNYLLWNLYLGNLLLLLSGQVNGKKFALICGRSLYIHRVVTSNSAARDRWSTVLNTLSIIKVSLVEGKEKEGGDTGRLSESRFMLTVATTMLNASSTFGVNSLTSFARYLYTRNR